MEPLEFPIGTTILRKKNTVEGITLPNMRLYFKAIIIKTAWYWHKNRHRDERHRTEFPKISSCLYGQLTFDKGGKDIQWGKYSLFNKWYWKNWAALCNKIKLDPLLHHTQV